MRNDAEKKKNVHREKFSQVATSPGAQRRMKMLIVQNPAPVTRNEHRFGIHNRKMGKKGPGQNNPEKRRKQENERPLSGPQQAT